MQQPHRHTAQTGFSIVEVLLAGTIFIMLVIAFTGTYLYGEEATALAGNRARAVMLAEEGLEAVRNIRDHAYTNLTNGTFGLSPSGGTWSFGGASDTSGIFTREIVIADAGIDRKSATARVIWQQNAQRAGLVSVATSFTNWLAYKIGNWTIPLQIASIDVAGTDNGNKIQVQGDFVYMTHVTNPPDFLVIDASNPASPLVVGSLSLPGSPRNIVVSGTVAYIASTSDTQELQLVNIANSSSPALIGSFNAPGTADGAGVFVSGTTAYLTRLSSADNEFFIINAAVPSAPTLVSSLNLNANGNEVLVSGTVAFIATSHDTQELQVINVAIPSSPSLAGTLDFSGTTDARTIAQAGTILFLGQGSTFRTVNVAVPFSPALLGSLGVSGTINDIALTFGNGDTYAFLGTSDATNEFKVINVASASTPVILGQRDIALTSPVSGVAYSIPLDRAFLATQSDLEEYVGIAPQE